MQVFSTPYLMPKIGHLVQGQFNLWDLLLVTLIGRKHASIPREEMNFESSLTTTTNSCEEVLSKFV